MWYWVFFIVLYLCFLYIGNVYYSKIVIIKIVWYKNVLLVMLILKFISFGICVILKLCNRKNLKLFIIKIVIDRFEVFELKKFNKIFIFW